MPDPTLNYLERPENALSGSDAGTRRIAYWQWGNAAAAHTVVCVHGLTRQGRDFDALAQALLARTGGEIRVVCADVAGRGNSDWLVDPLAYQLPTYATDMLALLAHLKPQTLDWVGTSMGGLIGIAVCSHAASIGSPIRRLVLNDVGPSIEWQSLVRIGTYVGRQMQFDSLQHAADAMWSISTGFGPHTPQQWLELSRPMVRRLVEGDGEQGAVRLHYDPAIAVAFKSVSPETAAQGEATLWALYDAISAQTLVVRGAQSDLLSPATALQMTQRGPKARLVEFPGVGHAPTLMASDQLDAVCGFLLD
jgi:pimeloyl-ACP methyl ester carboxylesterase